MSVLLEVVEGWTGTLGPFTLRVDDIAQDLSGLTVELKLHNGIGAVVTPGGTIMVLDQVANLGQVTYAPVATDFVLSSSPNANQIRQSYQLHWKVTDMAGKVVFFPNGQSDEITVFRP